MKVQPRTDSPCSFLLNILENGPHIDTYCEKKMNKQLFLFAVFPKLKLKALEVQFIAQSPYVLFLKNVIKPAENRT